MIYNNVDIYECKFFILNKSGKLEFTIGEFKGKTPDDFNTIHEIQRAVTYCFWIMNKQENKLVSKYVASAFIKDLTPKLLALEKKIRDLLIKNQKELEQETEESTKDVGTVYGQPD